jgi:hypothetical protein
VPVRRGTTVGCFKVLHDMIRGPAQRAHAPSQRQMTPIQSVRPRAGRAYYSTAFAAFSSGAIMRARPAGLIGFYISSRVHLHRHHHHHHRISSSRPPRDARVARGGIRYDDAPSADGGGAHARIGCSLAQSTYVRDGIVLAYSRYGTAARGVGNQGFAIQGARVRTRPK